MKEHKIFIYIFLIVGMILIFITPPFNAPDEGVHFKRAYAVSTGQLFPIVINDENGFYYPENLIEYIDSQKSFQEKMNSKYKYSDFYKDLIYKRLSENMVFNEIGSKYNPIIYTVPALGINLSKIVTIIMGVSPTVSSVLYGARIVSLLFYGVILYLIIKNIPKYKKTIMAIALMPMTLFLFSSVSYDHALIALSILLFSIVVKYRNNKSEVSLKDLLIIIFIAFIFLLLKKIYIFNLLSLLLIPKNKFKLKNKGYLKYIIIFVSILAVIYIVPTILVKTVSSSSSPSEQKSFILHNPLSYLKIYFYSIIKDRSFYLSTFVGRLGQLDCYLPYPIIFMYLVFLVITFFVDFNGEKGYFLKERVIVFLINSIVIFLSFLAMYIYWTSENSGIGANLITGVQGRYFIPCFVFLPFLFMNNFKSPIFKKIKNIYNEKYVIVYAATLLVTLYIMIARFWIG